MGTDESPPIPVRFGLILAHGRGDDCFPFGGASAPRAKYALEVADVPMVRRVAEALLATGVSHLAVSVGYQPESVRAAMEDLASGGQVRFLDVSPFDRGDAPGVARYLQRFAVGADVLIANGDLMADAADYQALVDAFVRLGGRSGCALVDRVDRDDRASWPTVALEHGGRLRGAAPDEEGASHRLSGAYVLPGALAGRVGERIGAVGAERSYLASILLRLAADGHEVVGVEAEQPLVHVDRCFDYMEANLLQAKSLRRQIAQRSGAYVYIGGEGRPDPRWIHPGVVVSAGARVVLEDGAMVSPFTTREEHLASAKRGGPEGASIRIQGDMYLGEGARIGFGADVGGDLYTCPEATVEDSVVLRGVVLGRRARVRRKAIVRKDSLLMAGSLVEAGADFEGVAGPSSAFMHPLTCFVCTGRGCEVAAGNFFGFLRFDQEPASFEVRGRRIVPKEPLGNATFLGDHVMTAVMVSATPGTRIGAGAVVGPHVIASGRMEGGFAFLPKRQVLKGRIDLLRGNR